ncbi:MAG TPA: FHA domain-containing protein [Kiritimatiellae bacterium]|nr:FHA domain-containing protein [Kiritimatiellia bacterium]
MARLIGMSSSVKGRTYEVGEEAALGRSKDNDIVINDQTVSAHHCILRKGEEGYVVTDLESTNGTRINTREVKEARLGDKDLLQVGSVEFLFEDPESAAVETTAYAEARVEEETAPVSAPVGFVNISPFTRRRGNRDLWLVIIALLGVIALAGMVFFFIQLISTG